MGKNIKKFNEFVNELFEQTPFLPIAPKSSLALYFQCEKCKLPKLAINEILHNNGISFKFYGINGYLSYLNLKQKKLLIKIDPDHNSAVEQKIWKIMEDSAGKLDNGWFINVILT